MAERILIIRLSAIGDIVMSSGLIPVLRTRYPRAHIAWLAEPVGAELLQADPRLDEVIVLPRPHWRALRRAGRRLRAAREIRDFARALRARRLDLALDPQGLLKSAIWAWLSGAPRRIGLGSREGSGRLMAEVLPVDQGNRRIASVYRQLAAHLGAADDSFSMRLTVSEDDRAEASAALGGQQVPADYAVLCPFTTRPQKHWFDERWVGLGEALHERTGLVPIILGGPGDIEHANRLSQASDGVIRNLAGALSLRASVAVIQRARLLVGVDTGLTHIATAAGIPTVALFGSTRPYLDTDNPNARVLYEPLWCSPCHRHPICGGVHSCMRVHHVHAVADSATSLLGAAA